MKAKTILIVICMIFTITMKGQFPAPINFQFNYTYYMMGDGGPCGDTSLMGPAYCSYFSWNAPDTSLTTATLLYYKLHYKPVYAPDTIVFTTTSTALTFELGVMGWVWVTAVYVNPDGESDSSNVVYNPSLPINVKEIEKNKFSLLNYDMSTKKLTIINPKEILHLKITDAMGNCMNKFTNINSEYVLDDIKTGLYIIEAVLKNHTIIIKKIVVN